MQETIVTDTLASSGPEIYLGQKIIVISIFLLLMWFAANYFVNAIKKGKFTLPGFLSKLAGVNLNSQKENSYQNYNLEIMQRKVFPDGSELMVLDVEGRHILLSKTVQSGITYITDLKEAEHKANFSAVSSLQAVPEEAPKLEDPLNL